ncbi:MAG TPA: chemotaxis protein CheW, partial [Azospirillum sp.]
LALRAGRTGGTLETAPPQAADPEPDAAAPPVVARVTRDGGDLLVIDPARIEIGHGMAFADIADDAVPVGGPPEPAARRGAGTVRLLVVESGGRRLALEMDGLLMVFAITEVRPLPHAPSVVRGMTQARDRPVLLVDPLGQSEAPLPLRERGLGRGGVTAGRREMSPGSGLPAAMPPLPNRDALRRRPTRGEGLSAEPKTALATDDRRDDGHAVAFRTPHGPVALRVDAVRGVVRVDPARIRTEAGAPGATVDYDGVRMDVRNGARMLSDQLDRIGRLVPARVGAADGLEPPRRVMRRFLTVSVGERTYALEFERVHRVVEYAGRRRLPGDTIRFDGVTGVDGAILPVLDLRRVLVRAADDTGVAVLVAVGGGTVAVIADAIQRIRKVPADDVDPLADATTAAVVRIDGRLVPVLRPEGLMAPRHLGDAA